MIEDRRFDRVEEIFHRARVLPEAERERLLADACQDDPELLEEIRQLLTVDAATQTWEPRVHGVPSAVDCAVPASIGPYRILRRLGQGGMGTVYLAEQGHPVPRQVALKVIKPGMDSEAVVRRFAAEERALAVMSHDNVARIHASGTTERGQPFFVMEYVPGEPIDQWCNRNRPGIDARIRLFLQVLAGVQHAHQKGLIHRDLKPSNVLVAASSGGPVVKVIDFGLARALEREGQTELTMHGQALGTLDYASPEQLRGDSHLIDTRTDVHALGVMLFLLLAGRLPDGATGGARTPERVLASRRRNEGLLASVVARDSRNGHGHAVNCSTVLPALVRALRGDLDRILRKATAFEPGDRYGTAVELAADLQRFLRREPVSVGPQTLRYRARKYFARYRLQVLTSAAVILGLAAGSAFLLWSNHRILTAQAAATESRRRFGFLSLVVRLEEAKRSAATLHPATAPLEPELRRWLDEQGEPLVRSLPELRAAASTLERSLAAPMAAAAGREQELLVESDRFLLDALHDLIQGIEQLRADELRSVGQRWHWARHGRRLTVDEHADAWRAASAAIAADPRFGGLSLRPQVGLVPLGADPGSRLQEFVHVRSGAPGAAIPGRDPATGRLQVDADSGIVLVLLPPCVFAPGAQSRDPEGDAFDPAARPNELPPGTVELPACLVGKYEVTQAQWQRISEGDTPSYRGPGTDGGAGMVAATHPVEQVSADDCASILPRFGFVLPREVQWEHACRGDARTPWHCGRERGDLARYANLSDLCAHRFAQWPRHEDWDDGYAVHAPVGTFLSNGYGLHDMHGNVWEWCSDPAGDPQVRAVRGGSFMSTAESARVTFRGAFLRTHAYQDVGVRVWRRIGAEG